MVQGPKRILGSAYGPLIWAPTCFLLVWVEFEVWDVILRWYMMGI